MAFHSFRSFLFFKEMCMKYYSRQKKHNFFFKNGKGGMEGHGCLHCPRRGTARAGAAARHCSPWPPAM
jgi:hypothetical protein